MAKRKTKPTKPAPPAWASMTPAERIQNTQQGIKALQETFGTMVIIGSKSPRPDQLIATIAIVTLEQP